MNFPAGWYDDPNDLNGQRYWDGSAWTEYRRPRPRPTQPADPAQAGGATGESGERPQQAQPWLEAERRQKAEGPRPADHGPGLAPNQGPVVYPGPPPYQGPTAFQGGSYQQAGSGLPGGPQYQGQQYQGPQHQGMPPYGGMPPYPGAGFGYGPQVPSTPDGVPLSGWWKRVWARLLDGLIVLVVSLPLSGYFWYQYIGAMAEYQRELIDQAVAGETTTFSTQLPWEVYQWILPIVGISLVVNLVYQYVFLVRSGATPGRKALGISVRLRDVPGPPPGGAVLKRLGFEAGLSLLGAIPAIGTLFGLVSLLDYLWPLWDDKKQALHDKVAATNVVLGPQPKR